MAKSTVRSDDHPKKETYDEEQLKDSYLGSFIIGLLILAIWLPVFFIYLNRL